MLQLIIFHVGLISRGMTTYEFIVAQVRARLHLVGGGGCWATAAHRLAHTPDPSARRHACVAVAAPEGEAPRSDQGWPSEQVRAVYGRSAEPGSVLRRLQAVR